MMTAPHRGALHVGVPTQTLPILSLSSCLDIQAGSEPLGHDDLGVKAILVFDCYARLRAPRRSMGARD